MPEIHGMMGEKQLVQGIGNSNNGGLEISGFHCAVDFCLVLALNWLENCRNIVVPS